ncbi:MAG: hypothetical protein KAU95_03175 [Candidatus Aenigmarchaeota archaeon]|nr:hypothetical protein [Candidatus Aenigmarchaeota archaeon]
MVSSPLAILFEIFFVVFYNTINTLVIVFWLFLKLMDSLHYSISVAGPAGIILAFIILLPLTYFLEKFFFGSAKVALITLFILGLFLVFTFLFI